jgi:non-homologous end joining protein Ku
VASGGKSLPEEGRKAQKMTNVIDLASVLAQSLADAGKAKKPAKPAAKKTKAKAA